MQNSKDVASVISSRSDGWAITESIGVDFGGGAARARAPNN